MKALACLFLSATAGLADPVSLFNGRDLEGWTGPGYEVVDGAIVCTPQGGNLVSKRRFAHYRFDFEFQLPPGGNNGIGIPPSAVLASELRRRC